MDGEDRPQTNMTKEAIVAELRALVRRRLGEQVANAKETEEGYDTLPAERRGKFKEELKKHFPTTPPLQAVPSDPHKKSKDSITRRSQHSPSVPKK